MENSKKENLVLTGGHAGTTAIALVEELNGREILQKKYNLYWIGAKSSVEGKHTEPIEISVLSSHGVRIHQITAGRLQRKFTFWTLPSILKIPVGFLNAFYILLKLKPKVIVSFGGYAAFPVVFAGKLLSAKVIVHEQTIAAGRANIISGKFADKVALSREESIPFFQGEKAVVTGNPVMKSIRELKKARQLAETPTIFVTLGSRGSQRINKVIGEALPDLLKHYRVIHLTGEADYQSFKDKKSGLPNSLKQKYEVYSTISPTKIYSLYEKAEIIIARAGANTVSEILITKIPTLFIPLHFSYMDEQSKNAKFAEQFGIARILKEDRMSSANLLSEVEMLRKNWRKMINQTEKKKSPDESGSKNLADLIESFL